MRMISNGITNKIVTSLVFEVACEGSYGQDRIRNSHYYKFVNTKECLLCGFTSSNGYDCDNYDNENNIVGGICYNCFNGSKELVFLSENIQAFLDTESAKCLKVLKKDKLYKKDYGKIKTRKIKLPKNLVKDINSFLIKKSMEQLKRYQDRLKRKNKNR